MSSWRNVRPWTNEELGITPELPVVDHTDYSADYWYSCGFDYDWAEGVEAIEGFDWSTRADETGEPVTSEDTDLMPGIEATHPNSETPQIVITDAPGPVTSTVALPASAEQSQPEHFETGQSTILGFHEQVLEAEDSDSSDDFLQVPAVNNGGPIYENINYSGDTDMDYDPTASPKHQQIYQAMLELRRDSAAQVEPPASSHNAPAAPGETLAEQLEEAAKSDTQRNLASTGKNADIPLDVDAEVDRLVGNIPTLDEHFFFTDDGFEFEKTQPDEASPAIQPPEEMPAGLAVALEQNLRCDTTSDLLAVVEPIPQEYYEVNADGPASHETDERQTELERQPPSPVTQSLPLQEDKGVPAGPTCLASQEDAVSAEISTSSPSEQAINPVDNAGLATPDQDHYPTPVPDTNLTAPLSAEADHDNKKQTIVDSGIHASEKGLQAVATPATAHSLTMSPEPLSPAREATPFTEPAQAGQNNGIADMDVTNIMMMLSGYRAESLPPSVPGNHAHPEKNDSSLHEHIQEMNEEHPISQESATATGNTVGATAEDTVELQTGIRAGMQTRIEPETDEDNNSSTDAMIMQDVPGDVGVVQDAPVAGQATPTSQRSAEEVIMSAKTDISSNLNLVDAEAEEVEDVDIDREAVFVEESLPGLTSGFVEQAYNHGHTEGDKLDDNGRYESHIDVNLSSRRSLAHTQMPRDSNMTTSSSAELADPHLEEENREGMEDFGEIDAPAADDEEDYDNGNSTTNHQELTSEEMKRDTDTEMAEYATTTHWGITSEVLTQQGNYQSNFELSSEEIQQDIDTEITECANTSEVDSQEDEQESDQHLSQEDEKKPNPGFTPEGIQSGIDTDITQFANTTHWGISSIDKGRSEQQSGDQNLGRSGPSSLHDAPTPRNGSAAGDEAERINAHPEHGKHKDTDDGGDTAQPSPQSPITAPALPPFHPPTFRHPFDVGYGKRHTRSDTKYEELTMPVAVQVPVSGPITAAPVAAGKPSAAIPQKRKHADTTSSENANKGKKKADQKTKGKKAGKGILREGGESALSDVQEEDELHDTDEASVTAKGKGKGKAKAKATAANAESTASTAQKGKGKAKAQAQAAPAPTPPAPAKPTSSSRHTRSSTAPPGPATTTTTRKTRHAAALEAAEAEKGKKGKRKRGL